MRVRVVDRINCDDGDRRAREIGLLERLRNMVFGTRDPESDLNVEMLEELRMSTGCELLP